jgi:hypothetical protein
MKAVTLTHTERSTAITNELFRPCDHVLNSDTPHFHWEQNIFGSENSYSNHANLLEFTNEYIYCNSTTYNAQINVIIMRLKLCA